MEAKMRPPSDPTVRHLEDDVIAPAPPVTTEAGLNRYLEEIRRFPMLGRREEFMLATCWREQGDREAVHRLVTSHLRLVIKIAMGYRAYGLPITEVISEGNIGLIKAVKHFEPEKRLPPVHLCHVVDQGADSGIRPALVVAGKIVTTANQNKLFFNLRKARREIFAFEEGDLRPDQVKLIAKRVGVTERDVVQMNRRLGGDASLNSPVGEDGDSSEWQDWLVRDTLSQETVLVETEDFDIRRKALGEALTVLSGRERRIFEARRLTDEPITLERLAEEFGVSRERVRQIEVRAFEKVRNGVRRQIAAMEPREAPATHWEPIPVLDTSDAIGT
jgi:RNA polymerase sigma-32 factor